MDYTSNTEKYPVKYLLTDLNQSFDLFGIHLKYDFQVYSEYINARNYKVYIQRLDKDTGWDIDIQIMTCNIVNHNNISIHPTIIYNIGKSISRIKIIEIHTEYDIEPSFECIEILKPYEMVPAPEPIAISREYFNKIFDTDIVVLPRFIFAAGIYKREFLIYNTNYSHYHESIQQIKHIISVFLTKNPDNNKSFYFLFCGSDGYMEGNYLENRNVQRLISEEEFIENKNFIVENPSEYPIFHKKKIILTQSQHLNIPYAIGIIDRHFFYCNLYHAFRSFHRGIPFNTKIDKIVYAGRPNRGTKWNFTERRDLGDMHPRQYFYSDAVPKDNIYTSETNWIDSKEMVNYKYILDIDGGASTWDATAWKLNSGSVILKQDSCWRQWFYDDFKPWVHYVPIKNDFSDIQEKFAWLQNNQEECRIMIGNCMKLFQHIYRFQNTIKYIEKVLEILQE